MVNAPVSIEQGVIRVVGCAFILSVLGIILMPCFNKVVPSELNLIAASSLTGLLAIFSPSAARSQQDAVNGQSPTVVTTSSVAGPHRPQ
jgi:hypothetical protein